MKLLIIIAIALLVGASIIWVANFEPGYVLVQYAGWSIETSLIVFSVAFVLLVVAGYMALRSLILVKQTPKKYSSWRSNRRLQRAGKALTRGLIALEEGRWADAERLLLRHASNSETPLLHYLSAARAAQKQKASGRRDNYLHLAHQTTEGAEVAIGVVQAELQLEAGQKEQALATLQHVREISPKHTYVLQMLQRVYSELNEWQGVQDVIPDLRKRHVLVSDEAKTLSTDALVGQLEAATAKEDWATLNEVWQKAPSKLRYAEPMLTAYVTGLIKQGRGSDAAVLIEGFMKNGWSDALAYQYGLIAHHDKSAKIAVAEKWLGNRQDNPWLLLTMGRIYKLNKMWLKAEAMFRDSIRHGERGETYQELAEVLAAEGGNESQVIEAYQKGLAVLLTQNKVMT
jgi:HemY protein